MDQVHTVDLVRETARRPKGAGSGYDPAHCAECFRSRHVQLLIDWPRFFSPTREGNSVKSARGTRLAAISVLSLSCAFATSASAAGRPERLSAREQSAPVIGIHSAHESDEQFPLRVFPTATTSTPVRGATGTGTQSESAGWPTAAAAPAGRAKARFDMDGDGRDEFVVPSIADPAGFVLHVHYSGLGHRETLVPPAIAEPRHSFSIPFTAGDFNGDGYQDLAVAGHRMLSEGVFESGVFVYQGSPAGLDRNNVRYLTGLQAGAFASGDLNNDGRDDLAVTDAGATEERDGPFRGSVTVLWGSAGGLTETGVLVVRQVVPRWPGLIEEVFGGPASPLAMGDFTGDGHDDLVVGGTRRGTHESDWHGIVTLLPGSADGLDTTKVSKLEGSVDFPANSLPIDVVVMSDMNQDGHEDLLLGLPRRDNGEIIYLPGAPAGLSLAGLRLINQSTPGIPAQPDDDATGGFFGSSLATGDATGDGLPDLLVGAMTMTVGGVADAGSVTLIPGTADGPTGIGSFVYAQRLPLRSAGRPDPWNPDPAEPGDYLGSAVAILDLDGTGPLEIFVESKYEDQQHTVVPFGLVTMLRLESNVPRRGSAQQPSARLVAVRLYRPADFADSGFEVHNLGFGLLSG